MSPRTPYTAEDIARYILMASDKVNHSASNLRLQRLLYFIDGYYMAVHGKDSDLFIEEFRAWKYGPAVQEVYFLFLPNGADGIPKEKYENKETAVFSDTTKRVSFKLSPWNPDVISEGDRSFIDDIVNLLSYYDDFTLVNISHDPSGPWARHYDGSSKSIIPKEEIRSYFKGLLK